MKKQFSTICLFLFISSLQAQNRYDASNYGEIYQITDQEAHAILADKVLFDSTWLHTFLGIDDTLSRDRLPPGHYLYVYANQEQVSVSLFTQHAFEVNVLSTRRELAFVVTDRSGQRITDARATLNGRKIHFDTTMQCYRLSKRKRGGTLEVQALGHTGFYQVTRSDHYAMRSIRWNRFARTPVGRVVAIPRYYLRNTWHLVRRPGNIPNWWQNKRNRKKNKWDDKEAWSGYVAFSQPKYRPGDTLKVKAWVTNRKGKPWNQPLDLLVSQTRRWRQISKQNILPTAPGVFVYQMVMSDSMDIDQRYVFEFTNPKPRKRGLFRQYTPEPGTVEGSAYYEDYQLDEIKYRFTQDKESYTGEDSILFHLSARDANGMPVPDGYYKLVVQTSGPQAFYRREVLLPDTLWQTEGAISATGDMDIRLPDALLPPAQYNLLATLYATNSAGELQKLELQCSVDRRVQQLEASIEKGWLLVNWKDKNTQPGLVLLQESYPNVGTRSDTIALPYRVRVKPEVHAYHIRSGQENTYLPLNSETLAGHQVTNTAVRVGDTVVFVLQNPQRIPVQYRIWCGNDVFDKGVTSDSIWVGQFIDREGKLFYARYNFVWAGEEKESTATLPFYKKQFNISVEQPENVQPGAQVQVKVRVTDQSEHPAAGVNLTAGAYNALFGDEKPYSNPEIKYKYEPGPLLYSPFIINVLNEGEYTLPLSDKWYKRLHLDTMLYYQLRQVYAPVSGKKPAGFAVATDINPNAFKRTGAWPQNPEPGILPDLPKTADSFYFYKPQFAPFVVEDFESQPIYMIWVNKDLVYYHGSTDHQSYSFYGEYGYNSIKIRVRTGEYTLDSVYLEKGKKVTFSFHGAGWGAKSAPLNAPGNALKHTRVRWEARPDSLSSFEQVYLKKSMLLVRDAPNAGLRYFWDYPTGIHIVYSKRSPFHILGPFPPNSKINVLSPGQFVTHFQFDPGFEYEIMPQRERLYASRWPQKLGRFPKILPLKSAFDWAVGPHHIQRGAPVYLFHTTGLDKPGTGTFRMDYYQKDTVLKGIVLRRDTFTGLYSPGSSAWYGLTPGIYQLALYTQQGSIATQTVQIRRDTLLYLNLSDLTFRPVLPTEHFDSLFQPKIIIDAQSGQYKPSMYYKPKPPGWGYGTIIQGQITDDTGEALIGASVKLMQGSELIQGAVTDFDGNYRMEVAPGDYTIEVSYTGYRIQRNSGIRVESNQMGFYNVVMVASNSLQEVVITALGVTRESFHADMIYSISSMPTRNINAVLAGKIRGVSMDGEAVNIKGARSNGTDYYLDGIRVSGAIPPLRGVEELSGAAQIRSRFRDYAYWQPHLLTDAQGEAVFQVTFPDDLTSWDAYAIATDKKGRAGVGEAHTRAFKPITAQLAVPRFAIAGDQFDVAGRITNHGADSVNVFTRFLWNNKVLGENESRVLQGKAEYMPLEIPADQDTALVGYELRSGQLSDGEQRQIPILPVGTIETNGHFLLLESDTSCTISFPAGPHPVTLYAENSPLDLLLQDVEFLYHYPYGCNEQTSGRLIGLLSMKKIKMYQKQPFKYEKDIKACLKRLKNTQLSDGAWGWWANGTSNSWMTIYVARALFAAQKAGYKVDGLDKALSILRLWLPTMNTSDQCNALTLLRECQVNIDCTPYLNPDNNLKRRTLTDRLNELTLRQLCGKELVRDSLSKYVNRTTFGGIYFGSGESGWYDRRAMNTLQAYEIARTAGWTDIVRGIERYWLQSRPVQRNTIETAKILEAILPGLLDAQGALRPVQLKINGAAIDSFPLSMQLDPAQGQAIHIAKTGSGPIYLTAYQQRHNPAPAARSDLFEVTTQLLLSNGSLAGNLKYGESAILEVQVQVKAAADYIMIEVPIPAGCGYGDKVQKGWPEVHREYFKDRTAIFCERLPVGYYTFKIPLEPRFTGRFTLNPARVEQMYFPVFFGRNEVGKVVVKR
jgi:alpha-2-macroglobulin